MSATLLEMYPLLLRPALQFLLVLRLRSSDLGLAALNGNPVDFIDDTVDALVKLDESTKTNSRDPNNSYEVSDYR